MFRSTVKNQLFVCLNSYGKSGVEFYYDLNNQSNGSNPSEPSQDHSHNSLEVAKLLFVSKSGRLLALDSEQTLWLLQIATSATQAHDPVKLIKTSNEFVRNEAAQADDSKRITCISIDDEGRIYVGTQSGDLHVLSSGPTLELVRTIKQEVIIGAVSEELKLKPGSVESIQPNHKGQILIGFSRSLVAYWDLTRNELINYFIIEQVSIGLVAASF